MIMEKFETFNLIGSAMIKVNNGDWVDFDKVKKISLDYISKINGFLLQNKLQTDLIKEFKYHFEEETPEERKMRYLKDEAFRMGFKLVKISKHSVESD